VSEKVERHAFTTKDGRTLTVYANDNNLSSYELEILNLAGQLREAREGIKEIAESFRHSVKQETHQFAVRYAEQASLRAETAERKLAEAEEAIREVTRIVLRAKTGEPRQAIWDLLKAVEMWASRNPAVRRALGKEGK